MFNNYYELKIEGKDVKRFLRQLYKMNIYFENVKYMNQYVYVKVNKDNYEKIKKIKTIYKIKINKLYGLNKIKDIIYRNNIFFICILLGVILLNVLCNIIFEIEIKTDNKEISSLVEKELKENGIKKYSFIKKYEKRKEIIEKILNNNKDELEWLEIERKGTKYIVRVEERIIKTKNNKCKPRNIIAKRDGIIMSINSSSGEIKKATNDYVKKGDIIISGIITKNEEEKNRICAEGKVYAETWYQVKVEVPYNYKEVIYTKEKKKNLSLTIFNKRYSIFNDYDNFITKEIFIKNNIIPIKLSLEENNKVIKIDHIYTNEELDLKALEISREKLLSHLDEDSSILLEKKLKTVAKNSTIEVMIFFKVKENITEYQNIE
ncbi:MAG: sporulation protein YqfD [Bacilli bacterium]|nr:sporulation protein YqfD [Bacilli bacterium]